MGGRRQRFFNCLAARVLVLKKHLTITGKMKAVKQVNMQRAVQKSTFYKMETQSNTEVFRITALDTSLLSCFPYSVFKQIGTSLVSTSTVFFDFSVLDKFSQNCKLLSTSYQKRNLAGKVTIAFVSCVQFVQKGFKHIIYCAFLKYTS